MLQYITFNPSWEKLVVDDRVIFHTPDKSFEYFIKLSLQGYYYCYLKNGSNSAIFNILGIDAEKFVSNVVNYPCKGDWPEAKTLDDLKKVIKALDDECIKKWGIQHNSTELNRNTSQLKVGDKVKILPRNGSQEDYYPQYVDGMLKYVGQLATITQVMKTSCNIDLDDSSYYWPFNALQLVTSEMDKTINPNELKNGDYVKITNNLSNMSFVYIFKEMKDKKIYRHATKEEKQTEIELNLFPKKKHYQLNFNY